MTCTSKDGIQLRHYVGRRIVRPLEYFGDFNFDSKDVRAAALGYTTGRAAREPCEACQGQAEEYSMKEPAFMDCVCVTLDPNADEDAYDTEWLMNGKCASCFIRHQPCSLAVGRRHVGQAPGSVSRASRNLQLGSIPPPLVSPPRMSQEDIRRIQAGQAQQIPLGGGAVAFNPARDSPQGRSAPSVSYVDSRGQRQTIRVPDWDYSREENRNRLVQQLLDIVSRVVTQGAGFSPSAGGSTQRQVSGQSVPAVVGPVSGATAPVNPRRAPMASAPIDTRRQLGVPQYVEPPLISPTPLQQPFALAQYASVSPTPGPQQRVTSTTGLGLSSPIGPLGDPRAPVGGRTATPAGRRPSVPPGSAQPSRRPSVAASPVQRGQHPSMVRSPTDPNLAPIAEQGQVAAEQSGQGHSQPILGLGGYASSSSSGVQYLGSNPYIKSEKE